MPSTDTPLWVHLLGLAYMAVGVLRLVCHMPQARKCLRAPHLAHAVSLQTWLGLLGCASVAFAYAILVIRDWPLIISTACNVAGPVMVIASVLRARWLDRNPT